MLPAAALREEPRGHTACPSGCRGASPASPTHAEPMGRTPSAGSGPRSGWQLRAVQGGFLGVWVPQGFSRVWPGLGTRAPAPTVAIPREQSLLPESSRIPFWLVLAEATRDGSCWGQT